MIKKFSQTMDMSGFLVQRKEAGFDTDLAEDLWVQKYTEGLVQVYTVNELKKAISDSNGLVNDVTDFAGVPGYVEPRKVVESRKTDEAAAHQENAKNLAQADLSRCLVPCNCTQVFEGMSVEQITATCRIYGLKVDTDKIEPLERILVRLSAGPMKTEADFAEWIGSKGVRRRAIIAEDVFPDFKVVEEIVSTAEPPKKRSLEEMLNDMEGGSEPLKKRKVLIDDTDEETVLVRRRKLATRAEALIKAMQATQVQVNIEMAGQFQEVTQRMLQGELDDIDFLEQLLAGEQCMRSEWPALLPAEQQDAEPPVFVNNGQSRKKFSQLGGKVHPGGDAFVFGQTILY